MAIKVLSAAYYSGPLDETGHYHDCHQILFVKSGEVSVSIRGKKHRAKAGSLVILNRFEQHSVALKNGEYLRYVLDISPKIDEKVGVEHKLFSILFNRPVGFLNILNLGEKAEEIENIFIRMVNEYKQGGETAGQLLSLYAQEFLLKLFRVFPSVFALFDDENGELVYKIQKDFEMNYHQEITLCALAKKYGMSESYLSHLFKNVTGSSVKGYLFTCRVAAAKKYLVNTSKRISEIVELCGFTDHSNFSRSFKNATGQSPLEFRKKYQGKRGIIQE